ncbi:hypothetical protein SUDANB105_07806 [Streptomyces sp. enrichment culture]|uniref:hypothetical protein n=1 Tax=Streptomyces sp. enrichment culture TaxID=1795815 RepID=UPI003F544D45
MANLRGPDRTIRFRTTDGEDTWLVRFRPDGFGLDTSHPASDTAAVRGTTADLLLLVHGRLPYRAESLAHEGDEHLPAHWFANSAFRGRAWPPVPADEARGGGDKGPVSRP